MTLQQVYTLLQQINEKYNLIVNNAKTIEEFNEEMSILANSYLAISVAGVTKKLKIQTLLSSVIQSYIDRLIFVNELVIVDNEVTVPAGVQALISNITYFTTTDFTFNIPFSDTGKNRQDIIVMNVLSQLVLISGVETTGIAVRPNVPPSTVLVTQINVTDSSFNAVIGNLFLGEFNSFEELEATHPTARSGSYAIVNTLTVSTVYFYSAENGWFTSEGGSGGGAVESVTGTTVDNTDPTNPIVNVPTLQQVTSKLLDVDGYAETTDGIKATKLKVIGFSAGDDIYGFGYSDNEDGFYDLQYIPFSGLTHNFQGSPKVARLSYSDITAIDNSDEKASSIISDGLVLIDTNTGKKILLKQPASIVGTDKVVQWRDRGGEPAFVDEIPAAITIDATPTNGSPNAVSSDGTFDALATKANLNGSTSEDFQVPTSPSGANSAVSKNYIDNALTGLTWKTAVKCSTTANQTLSGTSNIDGVTVPSGTRVLVRFQTVASENGIYVTSAGSWTRSTDADTAVEVEVSTVLVQSGTLYKQTQWTQSNVINTLGTDAVAYVQISGAGTYTASTGLSLVANVFSIISSSFGAFITSLTAKATLTDSDTVVSGDNASGGDAKKTTWLNVWINYIKAKADLVYSPISSPTFTGTVTTPAIIVSSETASTIASFDASKNIKSLDTATYPSLTEIAKVKGVNAPIQSQIDAKLGVVIKDATVSATVTGTTAETVLKTYTIPAGTFSASDIMNLQMFKGIKTGSGADGIQRIRINTTASLSGAVEIARLSGSSNLYRNMKRSFTIDGGNLIGYPFGISAVSDMVSDSAVLSSTAFNPAVTNYLMTTIELAGLTNTFYQRELLITK